MENIFVFLESGTIEFGQGSTQQQEDPRKGDRQRIIYLPELPISHVDGTKLDELVSDAVDDCFADRIEELANEANSEGVAADIGVPPDWLIAIGSVMWKAIVGGLIWEATKSSIKNLVQKVTERENQNFKAEGFILDEEGEDKPLTIFFRPDISDEENLRILFENLEEVFKKRGHEYDPVERERAMFKAEVQQGLKEIEDDRCATIERERERIEDEKNLIELLVDSDSCKEHNDEHATKVLKLLDIHLLNGIEIWFLTHLGPDTEKVINELLASENTPEEVAGLLQRYQFCDASKNLTELGKELCHAYAKAKRHGKFRF